MSIDVGRGVVKFLSLKQWGRSFFDFDDLQKFGSPFWRKAYKNFKQGLKDGWKKVIFSIYAVYLALRPKLQIYKVVFDLSLTILYTTKLLSNFWKIINNLRLKLQVLVVHCLIKCVLRSEFLHKKKLL